MTDKELIKQQQEKIERIEQLQEKLHKLSTLTLLTIDLLNLPNDLKTPAKVIHDVSHVIKDVLDGMSSQEAIEKNMIEDDEE
nr:MAG TPA: NONSTRUCTURAL RNA-BINDING PROTEIN 34/eukaryotic protein homodimer eIF4G.38A [Caudoviricetes sp.]